MLLTRLPLDLKEASFLLFSFDLHVLSTPPAFVLSQDQTLHDRSFVWLDYFLPCSNSLLGITTSHIGLIRSLYCSVFKEPSLFKRLNYLTTFREVCQMILSNLFQDLVFICAFDLSVFAALSCDLRDNIIFAFVCQLVFSSLFRASIDRLLT